MMTLPALALTACTFAAPVHADVASTVGATVDPLIESELKATGTPGAAFVFVHGGRIVHARGYGVSDLASGAKVDPARTVWPIASISKAVTAIAVLQLVADGRVGLDADIN